MAKARLPDQHGQEKDVELDHADLHPRIGAQHAPAGPGPCAKHNIHFQELHDEEIYATYGVETIFFCPKGGCDEFDLSAKDRGDQFKHHIRLRGYCDSLSEVEEIIIQELFKRAVIQRIILHREKVRREKAEKLLDP